MSHSPRVHCEWSEQGLATHRGGADVIIIVDVLSFSTCVNIAVSQSATIFPIAWGDARAAKLAEEMGAEMAGPRGKAKYSLSPATFLQIGAGAGVVLPSPNGARLSLEADHDKVLTGCLRNAQAVAEAATELGDRIFVVPAGDQGLGHGIFDPADKHDVGGAAYIRRDVSHAAGHGHLGVTAQ